MTMTLIIYNDNEIDNWQWHWSLTMTLIIDNDNDNDIDNWHWSLTMTLTMIIDNDNDHWQISTVRQQLKMPSSLRLDHPEALLPVPAQGVVEVAVHPGLPDGLAEVRLHVGKKSFFIIAKIKKYRKCPALIIDAPPKWNMFWCSMLYR